MSDKHDDVRNGEKLVSEKSGGAATGPSAAALAQQQLPEWESLSDKQVFQALGSCLGATDACSYNFTPAEIHYISLAAKRDFASLLRRVDSHIALLCSGPLEYN